MIEYRVGDLIKKSDKSYRTLAGEIGLAYATISKLAHARGPDDYDICASTLDKLCCFFKCGPGDILKHKNNSGRGRKRSGVA